MFVGEKLLVRGFVTQYKYLVGRPLPLIECLLGFQPGRMAGGAAFLTLDRLPLQDDFETAGYSQVAAHRHSPPADLDPGGLRRLAMSAWSPSGPDRLIKVIPAIGHNSNLNDDIQYPPGQGVPQWRLIAPIPATIAAILNKYDAAVKIT